MLKEQLYQVAEKGYQVAMNRSFLVPDVVQSFIDLIVVALVEPESHGPCECIDSEVDNGHEYEAVDLRVPLKQPSEKADDRIKSDAMKDYADGEFVFRQLSIYKPENRRQRTDRARQNDRYHLKPVHLKP